MNSVRRTGEISRNAVIAFVFVLVVVALLASLTIPSLWTADASPVNQNRHVVPNVLLFEKVAKAVFIGVLGITGFLVWNFLFQVANPDSMVNRRLNPRIGESPLPQAEKLPLEGD